MSRLAEAATDNRQNALAGQRYAIPAKPPKYIQALQPFLQQNVPQGRQIHIKYVFDRMCERWSDFRTAYGKQRPKRSAEEMAAMRERRLNKTLSKPALWDAVLQSPEVVPELRQAALLQKEAMAKTTSQVHDGQPQKKQRCTGAAPTVSSPLLQQQNAAVPNFESGSDSQDSDDGKDQFVATKHAQRSRARQEFSTSPSESSPVKKRARRLPRNTKRTLQEQFCKKVQTSKLDALKAEFYDAILEYNMGSDEEVPKLFETLMRECCQVNSALENVSSIMGEIIGDDDESAVATVEQ